MTTATLKPVAVDFGNELFSSFLRRPCSSDGSSRESERCCSGVCVLLHSALPQPPLAWERVLLPRQVSYPASLPASPVQWHSSDWCSFNHPSCTIIPFGTSVLQRSKSLLCGVGGVISLLEQQFLWCSGVPVLLSYSLPMLHRWLPILCCAGEMSRWSLW